MLSNFITYLLKLVGPLVIEWALKHLRNSLDDLKNKIEKDKQRDVVNEENLKKYEECKSLEECILQAKHTFNGHSVSSPTSDGKL